MSLESDFQKDLTDEIEELFPGCIIIKGNSAMRQGIPDWLILYKDQWAALEVKRSKRDFLTSKIPNQRWYVDVMNDMSFAAFVYPENRKEIIDALQRSFGS